MRRKRSRIVCALVSAGLGMSAMLLGASAASGGDDGSSPAPENLRLVLNDQGFVDALDWDPPTGAEEPARYDVNYRFASEGPAGEQVFWSTRNSSLAADTSFGRFVECAPHHHPSEEWIVWITYNTPAGPSQRSNTVGMCFP